jgi:hypothetical protein
MAEDDKKSWEPQPGDTVAIISGPVYAQRATRAEVLRLTKTQIVVKASGTMGASEARFRRDTQFGIHREVGEVVGRFATRRHLVPVDSPEVLRIEAHMAYEARLGLTLGRLDEFRAQRDVDAAKRAVEALNEFIQHEEGASEG